MDSSVLLKDQIWFLRMCHHVSNMLYCNGQCRDAFFGGLVELRIFSSTGKVSGFSRVSGSRLKEFYCSYLRNYKLQWWQFLMLSCYSLITLHAKFILQFARFSHTTQQHKNITPVEITYNTR